MTVPDGRLRTAGGGDSSATLPSVAISRAGLRDLLDAHDLEKACFGREAWGWVELVFALAAPGNVRLKALHGPTLVGLVIGESHALEGVGWVATLGVRPQYQRRGIGQALLLACEAALPHRLIKLTVRRSNVGAIALYRKFGYRHASVWHGYYAGGEDGLVMEKSKG